MANFNMANGWSAKHWYDEFDMNMDNAHKFEKNATWEKENIVECRNSIKSLRRSIHNSQDELLINEMYALLAKYKRYVFESQRRYEYLMWKANGYRTIAEAALDNYCTLIMGLNK